MVSIRCVQGAAEGSRELLTLNPTLQLFEALENLGNSQSLLLPPQVELSGVQPTTYWH